MIHPRFRFAHEGFSIDAPKRDRQIDFGHIDRRAQRQGGGGSVPQTDQAIIATTCLQRSTCAVCSSTTPRRKSSNRVLSPRLFLEMSPLARTSKGFLIVGQRVTSSSWQFKKAISRIRRFSKTSASTDFWVRVCESSKTRLANSAVSSWERSSASI